MARPSPEILKLPLHVRAEMAMKAAVQKAIDEHVLHGWPMYFWQDGKVVGVPAQELRVYSKTR